MAFRSYSRAFSTLGCVDLPLDEVFALASRHELDAVELRGLGGSLDVPAWLAQTYGSPEEFVVQAGRSPVRIAALDTSLRLIGNTADQREEFLQFIPWAEALGVPRLRVFDGGGKALTDTELGQALETLAWWNALRRQNGWRTDLMIETHDALITTPAILRLVAAAPKGTAALLWDAHHTWRQGGESPAETWQAIKASVVHVHVKDSIAAPSDRHAYTYVPPGEGEFPMRELRDALERDTYAGAVSLEWERHWHPKLAPLNEALTSATRHHWW